MTHERDFDRIAEAFMADGPTQLADRVLDAALDEVHLTSQRRVLVHMPWRFPPMNTFAKVAMATVAIVAVGAIGLSILRPGSDQVGAPTASPSPASSAGPSPSPSNLGAIPICTPSSCLSGPLNPGTYSLETGTVTPRQVTFSVPAGWTTEEGFVVKHGNSPRPDASPPPDQVLFFTWGNITQVLADVCPTTETLVDAGETSAELASLLAAQKGRVASAVTDVTMGGLPAKRIELTVPADLDVTPCGGILRFWDSAGGGGGLCCSAVGSTDVVYIFGNGADRFVVVARHQPGSSVEDRAELQSILESIVIEAPEASAAPSGAPSP